MKLIKSECSDRQYDISDGSLISFYKNAYGGDTFPKQLYDDIQNNLYKHAVVAVTYASLSSQPNPRVRVKFFDSGMRDRFAGELMYYSQARFGNLFSSNNVFSIIFNVKSRVIVAAIKRCALNNLKSMVFHSWMYTRICEGRGNCGRCNWIKGDLPRPHNAKGSNSSCLVAMPLLVTGYCMPHY